MWTLGLLKTMKDPKYVVYSDHKIVMIKDVYPKAKHHYLVIPHEDIAGIKDVKSKHIPLLEYMEQKAKDYVTKNVSGIEFKYGYHAKPSMHRLHLHVISTDMQSPSLKTKKHWNSFTTNFFLISKDVIRELKSEGKIKLPDATECERLLNQDLKCHKCGIALANMPKLKDHILTH